MHAIQLKDLPHYTYDDYKLWEGKWEILYGIAYAMSPAPTIKHQKISNKIARILDEKLSNCDQCTALLPVDWKIADDTIVQPDNLVICHQPKHEKYLVKSPEIIFEILSKSTLLKDKNIKFELYQAEGVKYYILVDQFEDTAKIYKLHQGKFIKLIDVSDETINFELSKCQFDFDFSKIWK
ncbi:MAG: Uma2 family endonuclease [Bacteroidales bacterium]|nr:Uma2 family endonuclease [Bacteroidales bacterium]